MMRMDILELLDTGQRVSRVSTTLVHVIAVSRYCRKLSLLAVDQLTHCLVCTVHYIGLPLVKLYTDDSQS